MADAIQQARAVGGIPSPDGPGVVVDLSANGAGAHPETKDAGALNLYQSGGWLPSDVASVVRLLERIYAEMLSTQLVRRGYVDQLIPLQAGIEQTTCLDARPYGYTQVAISATTAANVELVREGVALAVVLTPGRFATIQQPNGTKIRLKAGDPQITATFRYSDQIFGSVAP